MKAMLFHYITEVTEKHFVLATVLRILACLDWMFDEPCGFIKI